MTQPDAGWYPDPQDRTGERWWDGSAWSTSTRPRVPAAPAQAQLPVQPYTPAQPSIPGAAYAPAPLHPPAQPYGATPQYVPAQQYGAVVPSRAVAQPYPTASGALPIGVWRTPVDNRPLVRGMGDAIRVVFGKYAQFDGRASRSEYWYFALFTLLVTIGAVLLLIIPIVGFLAAIALIAGSFAIIIPSLAVLVRRLRDAGLHWAWLFLSFLPLGSVVLVVLCCQPSKHP